MRGGLAVDGNGLSRLSLLTELRASDSCFGFPGAADGVVLGGMTSLRILDVSNSMFGYNHPAYSTACTSSYSLWSGELPLVVVAS